ncbi:hypothetical protein HRJ34_15370 [Rhizorhabdus wittichii]|uniref:Uncharacterized protein n=1 Tax=Rhizorhabdus wittichii TaxID=160791 RepID=A0A975CZ92_9SPHN|nr:hypothetical protein [Rhizorhabdus wittichii]QTH19748.1 hypothetical protein HRJ34_15370 [Rhizorhabdus wittichii]
MEYDDLPPELLKQLSKRTAEDRIAAVIDKPMVVDEILIALWRRHKVAYKRQFIVNKLYRMANSGRIASVDGRKGMYEPVDARIEALKGDR